MTYEFKVGDKVRYKIGESPDNNGHITGNVYVIDSIKPSFTLFPDIVRFEGEGSGCFIDRLELVESASDKRVECTEPVPRLKYDTHKWAIVNVKTGYVDSLLRTRADARYIRGDRKDVKVIKVSITLTPA